MVANLDQSRQYLLARADEVNGLTALTWGPIALPTLGMLTGPNEDLAFVTGWGDGLVLLLACVGVSLLLGGWFYGGLAAASAGRTGGPLEAGRRTPRAVRDVLLLVAVLFGAAILLGIPALLLVGFTALVSPPVAVLGGLLVGAGLMFAAVHLFFAVDAIFVSGPGRWRRFSGAWRRSRVASCVVLLLRHHKPPGSSSWY